MAGTQAATLRMNSSEVKDAGVLDDANKAWNSPDLSMASSVKRYTRIR